MRVPRTIVPLSLLLVASAACDSSPHHATPAATTTDTTTDTKASAPVTPSPFGTMPDGTAVEVYTLTNASGVRVRAITYGAIIVSIETPDRDGRLADITLGFDTLDGYLGTHPFFGAIVGRYGNRIARATFTLDGKTYPLAANNGPNHLHGGLKGFDKVVWKAAGFRDARGAGVAFTRTSPDGEEGYPGNLTAKVTYTLTDRNELTVDYEVTTDKATPHNLTQHAYFNLAARGDILGHLLTINAAHYTPVDATLIPTGEIAPLEGSPLDFRTETAIGARIGQADEQLKRGGGYDHNFVLIRQGAGLVKAAAAYEPTSGRTLEVFTTEPGMQFYSGNFLDGTIRGKGGTVYAKRTGFCLETQHYPDSPNQAAFPTTILRPGATYRSQTVFSFGVRK